MSTPEHGLGDDPPLIERIVAFTITGLVVAGLALQQGAFDLVVRQEAGVIVWWVVALGMLVGVLPRTLPSAKSYVPIAALALFGVWTACSLAWTSSDERTLAEVARIGVHLGVLLLAASALTPGSRNSAIAGATAAAVGVCAVAFASRLSHGGIGADEVARAFESRRLSYPLAYWNAVGAWAGMTASLCLGWSAHARTLPARALALAGVPLAIGVAYLTYSRASLGGTVLGLVVLIALSHNRWTVAVHALLTFASGAVLILAIRHSPAIAEGTGSQGWSTVSAVYLMLVVVACAGALITRRFHLDDIRLSPRVARRVVAVGCIATSLAVIVVLVSAGSTLWDEFRHESSTSTSESDPASRLSNLNGSRYVVWRAALQEFRSTPIKGSGAGTFEFTWNLRGTTSEFVRDGHSLYLESLSELGLVGIALVVTFALGLIAVVLSAARHAPDDTAKGAIAAAGGAIAAFLFGVGVDWLWETTAISVLALVLAGAVIAGDGRPAPGVKLSVRALIAISCLLVVFVQLPGLVATSEVRKSQEAVSRGDLRSALSAANAAIDSEPWAATPLLQRALVEERLGRLAASSNDLYEARTREPENWRIPLVLARVEARRGNATAALAAFEAARRLRPNGRFFERGVIRG